MRLFYAFPIDDALQQNLSEKIAYLADYIPFGVTWVKQENLHITLQFLGNLPGNILSDLDEVFLELLPDLSRQTFKDANLSVYPLAEPKLIWLELEHDKSLAKFVKKLRFKLRELGIELEKREFKAHITLGRVKVPLMKPHINTIMNCETEILNITVDEVILYESTFGKHGVKYRELKQYNI